MRLFLASSFNNGISEKLSKVADCELLGKRVTFIPTAANVEKVNFYVKSGKKALEKLGLIVDELDVTTATKDEIESKLKGNDIIYVTGGNTFFLLQEFIKSGADKIIAEEVTNGKLYIGESAGAMIMSPNIEYVKDMDNCKKAEQLQTFMALNLLDFYPLPHKGAFPFAKAVEKIIAKYDKELNLIPINNSQAIAVTDGKINILGE